MSKLLNVLRVYLGGWFGTLVRVVPAVVAGYVVSGLIQQVLAMTYAHWAG